MEEEEVVDPCLGTWIVLDVGRPSFARSAVILAIALLLADVEKAAAVEGKAEVFRGKVSKGWCLKR